MFGAGGQTSKFWKLKRDMNGCIHCITVHARANHYQGVVGGATVARVV